MFVGEPLLFVWDLLSFLKATHCFLHLLNPLGSAVSLYPVFFPSSSSTSHLIRWYGCMYLLNLLSVFIIRVQFLHFFICDFVLFGLKKTALKLYTVVTIYNNNLNTITGPIILFIHIKLYSLKDASKHRAFFPEKITKKSVETSLILQERKKIPRSVPLFKTAAKLSRIYSGQRLILRPSVVVIPSIVFFA